VYADKRYCGEPNRGFLALDKISDGIMRKDTTTAQLTDNEIEQNKQISKKRYILEQYFGLSHLHNNASQARFPRLITNAIDVLFRQMDFNLLRGTKVVPA